MSDQILSQEEIDALLTAMDKGEVDYKEEAEEGVEVEAYDLTSHSAMLREQFYALEEVYDKFCNYMQVLVSTTLQRTFEIKLVSSEMVKYGEFMQAFSNPTSFHIFEMKPLLGSAMLAIEPTLVFALIECMFGGSGKSQTPIREFTIIEERMIRKYVDDVFRALEKGWEKLFPIKITLKKSETKPEFVHLVSPDELMIVTAFSMGGEDFSGNIHISFSYRMLEPVKEKLSSSYLREKDLAHAFSQQLKKLLSRTFVTLSAELGRTHQTVRDLMNMQIEDVVYLKTGPQDLITINVEDVPKFAGFPGIVKGNRAVQITENVD